MWTAPEKWNRTFEYHVKCYKFCLIELLWVFRCRYLLKILNAMGGGGLPISSDGADWRILGGVEIFDSGIFSVSISFTWGFLAYSKQSEVVILMLLVKQKKFLGVSSVSSFFFGGGGGYFCPHSIILSLEIWSSHPPPCLRTGCQKRVATFKITQLAFAHVGQ